MSTATKNLKNNTSTEVNEDAVYANYRAALKGFKHRYVKNLASERKQWAREATSDRYHLPISQVKAIVKKKEAENGVVHDYTEAKKHHEWLLQRKRENAMLKENDELMVDKGCQSCGALKTRSNILRSRFDRHGNLTYLCIDCL